MDMTASERTIMNIRGKAQLLEEERREAYNMRLSEMIIEMSAWDISPEEFPLKLAKRAFMLGFDCGCNKMYEYL